MKLNIIMPLLLVSLFAFSGCNSTKPGDETEKTVSNTQNEDTIATPKQVKKVGPKQIVTSESGRKVAVYDFEAFEKDYLQNTADVTFVFNFWATWCGPCVAELPYFLELEAEKKSETLKFVFISFDDINKIDKKVLPFLDERKIDSEIIVLDQKGINDWIEKIDKSWTGSIPATLVYNNDRHDFFEEKFESKEELETTLKLP